MNGVTSARLASSLSTPCYSGSLVRIANRNATPTERYADSVYIARSGWIVWRRIGRMLVVEHVSTALPWKSSNLH